MSLRVVCSLNNEAQLLKKSVCLQFWPIVLIDYYFFSQVALLEDSWSDLFLISLAQWKLPFNLTMLMKNINSPLTLDLLKITSLAARIDLHRLDSTEYACLKALAVFKPSKHRQGHYPGLFDHRNNMSCSCRIWTFLNSHGLKLQ